MNVSDYADFLAAVTAAVVTDPDLAFDSGTGTLTYTAPSDAASMTNIVVDLGIVDDSIIEGPEDFSIGLASPSSSTGGTIAVEPAAASVTTTINDTQGIGGVADGPAEWSISGPASADEGATAQYTIALTGQFGAGEVAEVVVSLADIDTNSADYAAISAALTTASAANPDVTFNAASSTLTYTSSGDGASMTNVVVDLGIVDDTLIEGSEDFLIALSSASSPSGASVGIDVLADDVTTTINDTQGPGGVADGPAEWSISGPANADEGDDASYTVSLAGAFSAGEVVSVDLNLVDVDTVGGDYGSLIAAITAAAAGNPDVAYDGANTLTFTAPSEGASMTDLIIDLPIVDDTLIEGPEDFTLSLSNVTSSTGVPVSIDGAADSVTTTINDTQGPGGAQDGPAQWNIVGPTSEDEGGIAQYLITLSGSFGDGEIATVDVSFADVTTNPSDYGDWEAAIAAVAATNPDVSYDSLTDQLTFTAPGEGATMSPLIIDLPITDDAFIEGPEQYSISLSNPNSPTGATIGVNPAQSSVTTTIGDTQGLGGPAEGPAEWSITGPATAGEGTNAQYTVSLSGQFGVGEIVTANIALTDVDTTSADYAVFQSAVTAAAAANPDVTFDSGTGTLTYSSPTDGSSMSNLIIDLGIVDDSLVEGEEDYAIAISNPLTSTGGAVALGTPSSVTTTITDNDQTSWSIAGDTSVAEGGTAQYTVALSGTLQAGETATIDVALADVDSTTADYANTVAAVNAAIAGRPELAFDGTTLTYTGDGNPMADVIIDLGAIDDTLIESDEDYTVSICNPGSTTGSDVALNASTSVTTTITDNDQATWSITGDTSVAEGGTAQYAVALSGTLQSGEVATIDLSLADVDTTSADYASFVAAVNAATAGRPELAFDGTTLTYTGDGNPMADVIIDLGAIDDTLIESDEDYTVSISNPGSTTGSDVALGAATSVTTSVADNDQASWSITGDTNVSEGATAQYMIGLSGTLQSGEVATIDLSLVDVDTTSADYTDFVAAVNAAIAGRPELSFDGTTLTYTGDGNPMADVIVDLGAVDDTLIEGNEDLTIAIANPASTSGSDVALGAATSVTTTIADNDQATWSITGDTNVAEGATAQYTIALSGTLQSGETATIELSLADVDTSSADYASFVAAVNAAIAGRPELTFAGTTLGYTGDGNPMADVIIDLGAIDDTLIEGDEDYTASIANPGSNSGSTVVLGTTTSVTTTITDNDQATWSITGDTNVAEGATAQYTIGLSGTLQSGETATIDLSLADVDTNSSDYANFVAAVNAAIAGRPELAFDGTTLTYTGDGSLMADVIIDLGAIDDTRIESDEDYTVSISNPGSNTGSGVALGATTSVSTTITDNDQATWSITGDTNVAEGAAAQYTVALNGTLQAGEAAAVDLSLTDIDTNSADYASFVAAVNAAIAGRPELAFDGTMLTYTGDGNPMADVSIDLGAVDDTLIEGDEDYTIAIANPTSATGSDVGLGAATSVTTTITDDDQTTWSITGDTNVAEGGTAQYTVALSGTLQAGETATIDLSLTDVDTNSSDYANFVAAVNAAIAGRPELAFDGTTLIYTGDGNPMADVSIDLGAIDDSVVEGDEDYAVSINNPGSATGSDVALGIITSVTTTITDNDQVSWSVTGDTSVAEGGTAQYTITLGGTLQAGETATIDLSLADIDTSSADYANFVAAVNAAITGRPELAFDGTTLTYTGDGNPLTDVIVDLGAIDDTLIEGDEDYTVSITNPDSTTGSDVALGAASSVTTTITDNDQATWSITGDTSVAEGATAQYTVALNGTLQAGETATVDLSLADVDTTSADYANFASAVNAAIAGRPELAFDGTTLTYTGDGNPMADVIIDLGATDDPLIEGDEDYTVAINNPGSTTGSVVALGATTSATTTITDNDQAAWIITGDTNVTEGGSAQYTIALNGTIQADETATVDLAIADVDTTTADYASFVAAVNAAIAGRAELAFDGTTLTYTGDGNPMADVIIDLGAIDDSLVEGDEDYAVSINNPVSTTGGDVALGVATSVTTTIIDNDETSWSIVGDTTVAEGGIAQYTITLSGTMQAGETATVELSLADVDTNSTDYANFVAAVNTAVAGRPELTFDGTTLTFAADGNPMANVSVDLNAIDDSLVEGDEDYIVSISNPASTTGSTVGISPADTVTTTITDNDQATWTIAGDANVTEGGTAQYTVAFSGTLQAGEVATVDLAIADVDTTTTDYVSFVAVVNAAIAGRPELAFDGTTLTYTGDGNPMADVLIDLGAIDDSLIEGDEDYTVSIANPSSPTGSDVALGATTSVTTTIVDNDQATWSIAGDTNVAESGTAQYTVALSGTLQAGETATIDLSLTDVDTNSADYASFVAAVNAALAGRPELAFDGTTLTYTGDGNPMADIVIDLGAIDDSLIEGDEDYTVSVSNPGSTTGGDVVLGAPTSVTTTITDNDQAAWSISGDANVTEGGTAQYTVAMTGTLQAGDTATVDLSLADIDTNSSDYANFVAAVSAAIAGRPELAFDGTTLTYTGDGNAMADLIIDFASFDDTLVEGDEVYTVSITNPGSTTGSEVVSGTTSVGTTIVDDDQSLWSINGDTTVPEGGTAQYTVQLSGVIQAGEILSVDLTQTDIDTNSSDYANFVAAVNTAIVGRPELSFDGTTLTYTSSGTAMSDLVINLPATDDSWIEGPEDFSILLSAPASSTGSMVSVDPAAASGTTTILDTQGAGGAADGPGLWSITGPASADEGTTPQYTVALSGQYGVGELIEVDLNLVDLGTNPADYASIVAAITAAAAANPDVTFNSGTGTLTYTSPSDGASMADLVIDLDITDDVMIEGREDFNLALTNAVPASGSNVGVNSLLDDVTTTILDTQGPGGGPDGPARWSIAGTPEVGEGNSATYTVSLGGQFQAGEIVSVEIGLNDNTTSPADYGNLLVQISAAAALDPTLSFDMSNGRLTFTAPADLASMTPLTFTLPITDDATVELPEDYDIALTNSLSPSGASTQIDPAASSVNTIINGDPIVVDDIQRTTVDTPVTDNVLTNDTDPDGDPLTVTTTPIVTPSNGTVTLATNGTYTYTPNPGFRGTDTFDYEVCDDFGNCEVATVTIAIADLSIAKEQASAVPNGDNFDVTFRVAVENTGATRIDDLSLFDDLQTRFGGTLLTVSAPVLDATGVTGQAPTLNATWPTNTSTDLLDPATTNEFLLPGDFFTVTFTATMDPDASGAATSLNNQAQVNGSDSTTIPGSPLSTNDVSDAGNDPSGTNPGVPGDTGGSDDPTPLFVPAIRAAKQQVGPAVELADRSWNVDFEINLENAGLNDLTSPSLVDDVSSQLGAAWHATSNVVIDTSAVSLGGIAPGLNPLWAADPTQDMLDGTGLLKPGESVRITFTLNIDPDDLPSGLSQPMTNQAAAEATASDGASSVVTVSDLSDSGYDPNSTNGGEPGDSGGSDDPTPIQISEIGAAKRIVSSSPISTNPGHVAMTYELRVRNLATIDLTNITLEDAVAANLGPAWQGLLTPPSIVSSTATSNPTINAGFDGSTDIQIFDGVSGVLRPGEEILVQFTVDVDVDQVTTSSINQATASADDGGPGVSDLSDTGSDPAGSNPSQTGDSGGEDDPTLLPAAGIAKAHGTPVSAGDNWIVPIEIEVLNLGATELENIQLIDDLAQEFGAALVNVSNLAIDATNVVGGTAPGINSSWLSDTSANILDGSGVLLPDDGFAVTFDVEVDPDATGTSAYLFNQAALSASDPANPGVVVADLSDGGSDPTSSNTGAPGDLGLTDDATPIEITDLGLAKDVVSIQQTGADFDVTFSIVQENTGTASLTNILLLDDVTSQFAPNGVMVTVPPQIVSSSATVDPNINAAFASDTSQNLFDGASGQLEPGQSITVEFTVRVAINYAAGDNGNLSLGNQAFGAAQGVSENGTLLGVAGDESDSGADPNSNNGAGDTDDITEFSVTYFTWDSFNNFAEADDRHGVDDMVSVPVRSPIAPIFSGLAEPGTTLQLRILDAIGNEVTSRTVMADAAGNWMGNLPGAIVPTDTYRIEVRQTPGIQNSFVTGGHNLRLYFHPTSQHDLYFREDITSQSVMRGNVANSLAAVSESNNHPLLFGWNRHAYELAVSNNVALR